MAPSRRLQHGRVHPSSARRALNGSGTYETPNNGQNRQGGSARSSVSTTSGDETAAPSPPPSPSNYSEYVPFSEEDPNLDADEAAGDSNVEGEEIDAHASKAIRRL